ncbi:MAG: helix-turn-helix transcriptional regulator [Clostridia bacterium]|nr:helix-turn-helix transcriptional regulator [Clostridia bacterium]MBQ9807212.1 helix-turn-helix transcriptional regulator [Clostridia bacterium]
MDVLKRINKLRLERDWSIYRLSLESGVSQSTLTNMFNRETLPSITTLEQLCAAFQISMAEFFTPPSPPPNSEINERQLYELYDALSDEMKKNILSLMQELGKKSK